MNEINIVDVRYGLLYPDRITTACIKCLLYTAHISAALYCRTLTNTKLVYNEIKIIPVKILVTYIFRLQVTNYFKTKGCIFLCFNFATSLTAILFGSYKLLDFL